MKFDVKELIQVGTKVMKKHSPEILTGVGIVGMATTVVLTINGTVKALDLLEEEKRERTSKYFNEEDIDKEWKNTPLTKREIFAICWKPYIPAVITFLGATGCLIGSNSVNLKRTAAFTTAYKVMETSYKEYKDKVEELIPAKKKKEIKDSIAEDHVSKYQPNATQVIITDKGNTLCQESVSGQYFRSDANILKAAQNAINEKLLAHDYVSLNELYVELGIEPTTVGNAIGWEINKVRNEVGSNLIQIDWSAQMAKDNQPCLYIRYNIEPTYGFDQYGY